jgi:uncharacterized protein YutE (UPF0331/DUF86 family)
MSKNTLITAALAFAVGIAVGFTAKAPLGKASPEEISEPETKSGKLISDSRSRIKTVTTVVTNTIHSIVTNTVETAHERPRGPEDFFSNLEKMKTENPERYAAMTNRMAQFRNRMTKRAENKLETLASIDTSNWSRQQIETHEKYQELIARHEELMDIIRHDSGASGQDRAEAFSELRELGRELRETSEKERNILLDKTFQELGYRGSEAKEIRESVKTIFSTTEEWGGGGRGGRRHGFRPR